MAGAACKIIINDGVGGLSKSIEKVLTSPLVRDRMMPSAMCDELIQALADFDLRLYTGVDPRRRTGCAAVCEGLRDVLGVLKSAEVITDEVMEVFA